MSGTLSIGQLRRRQNPPGLGIGLIPPPAEHAVISENQYLSDIDGRASRNHTCLCSLTSFTLSGVPGDSFSQSIIRT